MVKLQQHDSEELILEFIVQLKYLCMDPIYYYLLIFKTLLWQLALYQRHLCKMFCFSKEYTGKSVRCCFCLSWNVYSTEEHEMHEHEM